MFLMISWRWCSIPRQWRYTVRLISAGLIVLFIGYSRREQRKALMQKSPIQHQQLVCPPSVREVARLSCGTGLHVVVLAACQRSMRSVSCMIHNIMTSREAGTPLKCIWHILLMSIFNCKKAQLCTLTLFRGRKYRKEKDDMMRRERSAACVGEVFHRSPVNILQQRVSLDLISSSRFQRHEARINTARSKAE